jgi:hypothetical protein
MLPLRSAAEKYEMAVPGMVVPSLGGHPSKGQRTSRGSIKVTMMDVIA